MTCDNCHQDLIDGLPVFNYGGEKDYLGKKLPAGEFCSLECLDKYLTQKIEE